MWEKFTLNRFPSSHMIEDVSSGHTGREVHPTTVSTPALMPSKEGSAVILKAVISILGLCQKLNYSQILENPCKYRGRGQQVPDALFACGSTVASLPGVCLEEVSGTRRALGACGRDGSRADSTGQALEREAETVRETGSQ